MSDGLNREGFTGPQPAMTPGQAACVAWNEHYAEQHGIEARNEWAASDPRGRGAWEAAAQAAINAQQPQPAPESADSGPASMLQPVTFNDEPELTGRVSIRFPAEMIPMIKRLAAAKGMTVSAWIRHEVEREAARRGQSAPDAGVPSEALDIAWNALQHIALHGDDKSAAKSRETLRAVNEYLEDGTTEDGIDRTPRAAPAPEAAEMRAVIDMIWRMCQQPGGERLAERIAGLIKNSGMEPF